MPVKQPKTLLGFVPASRGFFSKELAAKMRRASVQAMQKVGVQVVVPSESDMPNGCVETLAQAKKCGAMFRGKGVHGIVIGAMNFGDEQSAATVVRAAALNVPILLFGGQEANALTKETPRRDAFCGLISIAEALRQIGAPYSIAPTPIGFPEEEAFGRGIDWFARVCRVVRGVRGARYGQVGARPEAFWTCRFDEKSLQKLGPTTVVLDLSEAIGAMSKLKDNDPAVKRIMKQIDAYADTSLLVNASLVRIAKLELFLRRWAAENELDAMAIQCWTSIQNNFGACSCTTMSRLTDEGIPCACEADILGTLSMHAAQLASGGPAALADWNNLHNDDDQLVNLWHCGVFPASFAKDRPRLNTHGVLVPSGATPADKSGGVIEFVMKESDLTLTRVTQEDGRFKALVEHGQVEANAAETFGSYGWCRIPHLGRLYRDVVLNHFPHHVAMTHGNVGNVLWEAFGKYLGMQVYHGTQSTPGVYTPALPFGG
ncbi:MAG: L-fucose/L-arabinose isomerase family protein [Planctomycetes bacterium]|nr:L-fucose/L-arabinose isomerase family protein [Planctomycetota bacterium]